MKAIYTIQNFAKRLVMVLAVGLMAADVLGVNWNKITNLSDLSNGDSVLVVLQDGKTLTAGKAVSVNGTTTANSADVTITSNSYISNPANTIKWAITNSSGSNYIIKSGSYYLSSGSNSSSNHNIASNITTSNSWYITKVSNGYFKLQFENSSGQYLTWKGTCYGKYATSNFNDQIDEGNALAQYDGAISFYKKETGYAVTYNNGGHGTAPSSTTATSVTLAAITGVTGYTCTGWKANVAVTVGGVSKSAGTLLTNGSTATLSGATTFTAQWSANEYTISLDNQSATSAGSTSIDVTYNASTNLTETPAITVPTKTHYDFGGYYTAKDGGGSQIIDEDGDVVASVSTYTDASKNWIKASDVTLYAKWTEHTLINYRTLCCTKYDITLEDGGVKDAGLFAVTKDDADIDAACEGTSLNLEAVAADGYAFSEWVIKDGSANDITEDLLGEGNEGDDNIDFEMPGYAITIDATFECVDPDITVDPVDAEYVEDYASPAALSVTASAGGASLGYQWQSSSNNEDWDDIAAKDGGTASTYTPSTASTGTTYYRVIVSNAASGCSTTATSAAATITITEKGVCLAPTFSVSGGTYTSAQSVELSCATVGATIYYTTNGSEPTTSSSVYSSAISVTATTTIKAIAAKADMTNSSVSSATYTIKCVFPTFSVSEGTYNNNQSVTLSTTTDDATIYYTLTTNGNTPSDPTSSDTEYEGAITIDHDNTKIKAIAIKSGLSNSEIASITYRLKCATPTFDVAAGSYVGAQTVAITSSTTSASIYYTDDGSTTPTSGSTAYSDALTVGEDMTLKAIAIKSNYQNSDVATAAYDITPVHSVTWLNNGDAYTPASPGSTSATDGTQIAAIPSPAPSAPTKCSDKVFVGWTATEIDGSTDTKPSDLFTTKAGSPEITGPTTFHAVWADEDDVDTEYELTNSEIQTRYVATGQSGATTSYGSYDISSTSGTWSGYMVINVANSEYFVQISSDKTNRHLGSPEFDDNITSIVVTGRHNASSARNIYICSSNETAQPSSGDIGSGSIDAGPGSGVYTDWTDVEITPTGNHKQFYIYANGGLQIKSVTVTTSRTDHSGYVTACCKSAPVVGAATYDDLAGTTVTVICSDGATIGSKGCAIEEYGFVVGSSSNPSIGGSGVTKYALDLEDFDASELFSASVSGLTAGDTYYARAFATNAIGTTYGTQVSFTTKAVTSIAVKTSATQTAYVNGESFNGTGLVITETYNDKTTRDVAYSGNEASFSFSPSPLTTGTTSVTITCSGKTTTQSGLTVYSVGTIAITDEDGKALSGDGKPTASRTGAAITTSAGTEKYVFKQWTISGASLDGDADEADNSIVSASGSVSLTAVYYKPRVVTWKNNNAVYATTYVEYNTKPEFPSTPSSDDATSTTFYGWSTATWDGKIASVAGKTIYTDEDDMLAMTAETATYHAVFVKEDNGFKKVTSLSGITAGKYIIVNNGYALPAATTTSSTLPSKSSDDVVEVNASGKITSDSTGYVWTFSGSTYSAITITNNSGKYLYATNNNDGLHVYTTSDTWAFETNTSAPAFAMQEATNSRYCATYTSDWRSYTSKDHSNYGDGGKIYLYKYDESREDFMTTKKYTVTCQVNTAGYGTVSSASVANVLKGTSISASSTTLTVGATEVTATPTSQTAQYTYAFSEWSWTPSGSTIGNSDVTATATFTRTLRNYTITPTLTNVTINTALPANQDYGSCSIERTISPSSGYILPTSITVTNATYTWNSSTGALAITEVTGPVSITITGVAIYTITLDAEGGSGSTESVIATEGLNTLSMAIVNPLKANNTFVGWYSGDNGTGYLVISISGALQPNVTDYTGAGGVWEYEAVSHNLTLYAKWMDMDDVESTCWVYNDEKKKYEYGCDDLVDFDTPQPTTETINWSEAVWGAGSPPTTDTKVVLTKHMVVDVTNARANAVDLAEDITLTVSAGKTIVIAETLTKDGGATTASDVKLLSDASNGTGALIVGGESTNTQATVGFYTKAKKDGSGKYINQYIGVPFASMTTYDRFYGTYLYSFDVATDSWKVVPNNGAMYPFTAYNLLRKETSETTFYSGGTIVLPGTTDHKTKELIMTKRDGEDKTENMFANSWTAPIDIKAMETSDFVGAEATIYIFNAGTYAQQQAAKATMDSHDNTNAGQWVAIPVEAADYTDWDLTVIPSQQAFLVYTSGTGGTYKLTLDYKKHVYEPAVESGAEIKPTRAPRRTTDDKPEVMSMRVAGESGYADVVYMFFREDFSDGFDNGWDGRKMEGSSTAPQMYAYSVDGKMAIHATAEAEGTLLGFKAGNTDNLYTVTFSYEGDETYYLNDLQEQESALIEDENTYMFYATPEDDEARFVVSKTPIHKIATDVEGVGGGTKARKLLIEDKLFIIRGGHMYSADGALVK